MRSLQTSRKGPIDQGPHNTIAPSSEGVLLGESGSDVDAIEDFTSLPAVHGKLMPTRLPQEFVKGARPGFDEVGGASGNEERQPPCFRPSSQFRALSCVTTKVVSGLGSVNCCFSLQGKKH